MDSIINFIINCILSVIDLYLINFYILNYNHKADENTNYLQINTCNLVCLTIFICLNFVSPGLIICIPIIISIIVLQITYNHLPLRVNIKLVINFIILKLIIHFLCHFIFSWLFDTPIISIYPKYIISHILLILFIEKFYI